MLTKRWHIETDPCEAMEGALDNLRDIVQATFAHLDRSTQIEILETLGWEQK